MQKLVDVKKLRALDLRIAKELGWHIVNLNDNPHGLRVKGPHLAVTDGHGNTHGHGFNEEHAWDNALRPGWARSMDGAMVLITSQLGLEYNLFSDHGDHTCEVGHWADEAGQSDHVFSGSGDTPSEAVCEAWLKYRTVYYSR